MKEFDFMLDPETSDTDQICRIMHEVRPDWSEDSIDSIEIKRLQGGYVNTIWLCSVATETDKLIIRINPNISAAPHVDRDLEHRIVNRLSDAKLIQPHYARFRNGLVYRYAEGTTSLGYPRMEDDNIPCMILRKIAPVHDIPLNEFGAGHLTIKDNAWYGFLAKSVHELEDFATESLQQRFKSIFTSKKNICKEAGFCMNLLDDLWRRYPHVVGHFDLWYTNLVYDEEKADVHIIDWEFGGPGVAPFELAFVTEDFSNSPDTTSEFEERVKRSWIRAYLEQKKATFGELTAGLEAKWFDDLVRASAAARMMTVVAGLWIATVLKRDDPATQEAILQDSIKGYLKYAFWKSKIDIMKA